MTSAATRVVAVAAACIVLSVVRHTRGEPLEPPPEASEGADYAEERADSLGDDSVEIGVGASAGPGRRPARRRRVRFRGEGFRGSVREGHGDPLSGGVIEGVVGSATVRAGRLAPRWGRGLVLGAPAEPWTARAHDRGRAPYRGRAGEGVSIETGRATRIELIAGRFARRTLFGFGAGRGVIGLGAVTDTDGSRQWTLHGAGAPLETELAMDGRGRWRAEVSHVRAARSVKIAAHVRGGAVGFRSLAEPLRSGPAQSATVAAAGPPGPLSWSAIASAWRFAAALPGARGAARLDVDREGVRLALGAEAQRGVRRLSPNRLPVCRGPRQGLWGDWRVSTPRLELAIRQEHWGERGFREVVRRVSGMRVELRLAGGVRVRLAHTVFRARSGESLYLTETYSDRLVLRALAGRGERTRLELVLPAAGGRLTSSLSATHTLAGAARVLWEVDWTRRAKTR